MLDKDNCERLIATTILKKVIKYINKNLYI